MQSSYLIKITRLIIPAKIKSLQKTNKNLNYGKFYQKKYNTSIPNNLFTICIQQQSRDMKEKIEWKNLKKLSCIDKKSNYISIWILKPQIYILSFTKSSILFPENKKKSSIWITFSSFMLFFLVSHRSLSEIYVKKFRI